MQNASDLHEIHLQVGELSSKVEVTADAVHVATESADRSIDIDLTQIDDTPTRGRNRNYHDAARCADGFASQRLSRLERRRDFPESMAANRARLSSTMTGRPARNSGNLNPG